MTKRRIITLVAMAIFVGLLLFAVTVKPQPSASGDYGAAFFYRNDIWSRDGMIEQWTLDPGVEGSIWQNSSFEIWDGTHATCTDCPTDSIICLCAGGGDVNPETTYYYDYDTSMRLTTAALFGSVFYLLNTWEENSCYQISFWYRGTDGTEDLGIVVGNITVTDTYNFATDAFTAPLTVWLHNNIPTTWTRASVYVVGAAGKTLASNYGVGFYTPNSDGDYVYIDNVLVQKLKSCGVIGARGNVLSVPVTSDPLRGQSENLLPRTGTGPAYKTGVQLDGVTDFVECADATCEMDPVNWAGGGKFSVACRVMTDTVAAGTDHVISKWTDAGNQRSWRIRRGTATLGFVVSDDGTNTDINTVGVFVPDALHSFVSTFDPSGGSGACENNIYYDAYQVDTDATMTECGPFDSTSALNIGAYNVGTFTWDGPMYECVLWEKELTAIESNKYISPHFPDTNYGDGFYVDTCSQAASHSTCSTQKCRDGTPNECQAEGTGVMACYGEYDEELDNNSFEAYTGDPSDGDFDDWPTESGDITVYLADSKHGNASARIRGGSLTGECIVGGGADTYFEISAKQLNNGGGTIEVWLREYDFAGCTSQLAITYPLITCTPGGVWDDCGELFAAADWHASTSTYKIQIIDDVDGDMLIDNVSIKEASYHTPFVHNLTGATTYTSREYKLHSPLSDYCQSEAADCYLSGFCGAMWVHTDWAGDDGVTHQILTSVGTAGVNNRWIVNKPNSNNIQFVLYDAAGDLRSYTITTTGTNWTAGGWKYLEWCSNNSDDVLKGRHYNEDNETWYDWSSAAGAGTGIQDGQAADLHIGHDADANYLDGSIPEIHLGPYSDIWPQTGFNGGRPPVNDGAPY